MHDDWRLQVDLAEEGAALELVNDLRSLRLERDVRQRLGDRVAMTHEGATVHLYADREEDARAAERVLTAALERRGWRAERTSLCRWHPEELRWEDAAEPLPSTPAEHAAEEAERQRVEAADSAVQGWAEWEVRVELPSHEQTQELGDRLEAEGIPVVRRWRFLLVGAATEDAAQALAERIEAEAPEGARVLAEGSGTMAWRVTHPNPFAYFDQIV